MLNFYQWCKHLPAPLAKKNSATTPIFLHVFGRAPSDLQPCFAQLKTLAPSARYSTFKYPVTLKPVTLKLKVIENYTIQSGTHDFLLTFHSNHRPVSHRFRDKRRCTSKIERKSPIFPPPVFNAPDEGVPLGIWYRRKGSRMLLWRGYQMVEKVFRYV